MSDKPNDTLAVTPVKETEGKAVLIVTANDTQDLEFFYPYYRLTEAGYHVDVATPEGGEFKGKMGMGLKETKAIKDVKADAYALLYIPGGKAPEALKECKEAVSITQDFAKAGKPIAAICHGAQLLAKADVIRGKNIAAWPEVQPEIEKAGGTYVSQPDAVDGQFITGRWPGDLPAHLKKTLQALQGSDARSQPRMVKG